MYTAMIVDDEYPARNMLDLLIDWEECGFRIIAKAENGKQALEIYQKERPNLVITDIQMPVMDGIQLIEEIRKANEEQCVVVLSCHESFYYAQQAIRLGVKDYLIKDMLTADQLKECLERTEKLLKSRGNITQDDTKMVFSREPDENIRQAYPIWLAKAENRMDLLQNSLSSNEYEEARNCIRKLYQAPFDGLVRYHFLDWVNRFVYQLIRNQCQRQELSSKDVFGRYDYREDEILMDVESEEKCCQILCGFIDVLEKENQGQDGYSVRIQNVIKYLQENYYYDISLQTVAEHFGVHKVYLARSFKSETGETLNEFLNKIRVEKAKLLLSITDNKANEIAYTVGFNNTQSFYNVFKKYTGFSPNEYRKEYSKR